MTLRNAYLSSDSRRSDKKVTPPAVLVPLLPEIAGLVNYERRREIQDTLMRVAPPPQYEQTPYEYMEHCYEATMLSRAVNQAMTLKALQTLALRLNDAGLKEVLTWAQLQSKVMRESAKPENLYGEKYLQTKLPPANIPSLLDDIPTPDTHSLDRRY